ncbi:hypothetical protein Y032_0292g1582 [Ancylostoma ceylanicum]|uniref:Uncharacterized protein n=1 Tax=Ancylostoma ceylanicum TaxID=53326 RepID=A0A016S509_9BILA|nr:hypothetical protein Y032_0292g1582 [Ancylostoma ceylanicum]
MLRFQLRFSFPVQGNCSKQEAKFLVGAKEALESKEIELRELTAQLQSEKMMSDEERRRLREEVAQRENEVQEMRTEVQRQTEVTHRLQDEVEAARREALMQHSSIVNHTTHVLFIFEEYTKICLVLHVIADPSHDAYS